MIDFEKSEFPVVSICCITYNHAKYIKSALDGFLKQHTDFDYEILIHDDCSTDGTTEIIKDYAERYPDIIFPLYEDENQWVKGRRGNLEFNYPRARGKYIALCEGDDYWIDEYKLQKQVEYLENHPECGLCYTSFDIKNETNGRITNDLFRSNPKIFPRLDSSVEDFLILKRYMCPPSWLLRRDLFPTDSNTGCDGSFVIFSHYLANSKIGFIEDVTCVYRVLAESASHSNNYNNTYKRACQLLDLQLYLADKYNLKQDVKERCIQKFYKDNLVDFIINRKRDDINNARKCLKKDTRDRILLLIDRLGLSWLLYVLKKNKRAYF